ncbi:MAG TPA: YebC/PmpR family DNA-binding transcriptional regulator [Candidatus Woesebacteria bacterium]|nr:YebC/PmpR family DNA-binding transcriptional regulator [Candidatus Woesebacteria bacterium]
MSGHSKWANIKHKKAALDNKRGIEFSKISRGIRIAVREGGSGDPNSNQTLRIWLEKAKEINLPKDNITRAIQAGLGQGGVGRLEEVIYEGFDAKGVGLLVVTMTENKNRTTSEVRFAFSRAGGSLGSPGSAKYLFSRDQQGKYHSQVPFPITDETHLASLQELVDNLLELEDVDAVYCTCDQIAQE